MKTFQLLLYCIGSMSIAGCLPDPLAVDGVPQLKSKIVVSTQFTSDQSVVILLTRSVGALEASDDSDPQSLIDQIAIRDATVTLYNPDITYRFTALGNGLYSSGQVSLMAGDAYTLLVESPTMGTVHATTTAYRQVTFDYLDAQVYDNGYDTLAEIAYRFYDPTGSNFYMLNVQRLTREIEPEELLNPEIFIELMNDKSFEGSEYFDRQRVIARRDFVPGDTLSITLSNISEAYFDFMQVRIDSRFNFSEFLGEPANYPTNVVGGLGFFNLCVPDVRILELKGESFKPF